MSSSVGSPPVSGSKVTRGPGRPRKAAKGPLSPAPVISDTTTEEKPSSEEEMKVKEIIDTPPQSKYSTRSKRKSKPEPSKTLPVATAVTKPEPPTILDMIREPSPPEGSSKQATAAPLPSSSEEDATEVTPLKRRYATRRVHSSGGSIIEQLTSSYSARREPPPPPPPPPLPPSSSSSSSPGKKRLLSPKGSTGITSPRKQPTRLEKDSTKSVEKDSTKSGTSVEKHSVKSSKSLEKDSAKGSKVGTASSSATAARSPVKRGSKGRAVKASVASPGKLKTALRSSKRGQRSDEGAEGVKSEILGETASNEDAPGDSGNEHLNQALSEDKSATDSNVVTKQETSRTAFHPPTKALDPSIAQASHTEPTNQPSTPTDNSSGEVSNLLKKDTPIEGDGGIMAPTSGRRRDTAEAVSITLPESTATRGDVSTIEDLDSPPETDQPGVSSIATSSERSSTLTQKAKGGSTILAPPQADVKTLSKDPPVSGGKKETIMATSPTAGSPGPSKSGPTDVELMEVVKEEEEGEGTSTSKAVGQVAQNSPELPTAAAAKTSVKETEPGNGEKESSNGEKESGNGEKESGNGEKVSGDDSAQPVEDKMSKEDTKEQAKGGVTEKSGISSKIVEQTTSKQVSASTSGPASASTSGQASGPAAGPAAGEGTSSSHPGASKKVSPPPLIPVQPGTYSSQGVVRSYF